jgi:cell division FtsZ-interacting protein ZapD
MNINRLIFTIEDCLNTLSRFSVASSFVEYCDLRTVIGLDRQDRERRPWLNSPYIACSFFHSILQPQSVENISLSLKSAVLSGKWMKHPTRLAQVHWNR